ncbi:MAG: hypothetical protein WC654_02020 [Patescibacteria group bacterium]
MEEEITNGQLADKFDQLGVRFDQLGIKFDQFIDKMDDRFEKIDQRFDKMDDRFDKMDDRFDKMDDRFDKADERFDELVLMTKMGFDDQSERIEANTQAIQNLDNRFVEQGDWICGIQKTMDQEFAAASLGRKRIEERISEHDRILTKIA